MGQRIKVGILTAVLAVSLVFMPVLNSQALKVDLGDVLGKTVKVAGVAWVVDKFGKDINNFINNLMSNNNVDTNDYTKVVPILSVGSGGYVGAVQVLGTKEVVEKCKAVVQYEDGAVFGTSIRVKLLVPVEARSITNVERLKGVGVSAIVDIEI